MSEGTANAKGWRQVGVMGVDYVRLIVGVVCSLWFVVWVWAGRIGLGEERGLDWIGLEGGGTRLHIMGIVFVCRGLFLCLLQVVTYASSICSSTLIHDEGWRKCGGWDFFGT